MMTHILFVDTGKEWGGGTNSLLLLTAGLVAQGYRVSTAFSHNYAGQDRSVGEAFRQTGATFHVIPSSSRKYHKLLRELVRALLFFHRGWRDIALARLDRVFRIIPAARQLADLARRQQADILIGNNQPSSNQAVLLAGCRIGLPVILHVRKTTHLQVTERDTTNANAAQIICVSESVRRHYLSEGLDNERCITIPNGIDPDALNLLDRDSARAQLAVPDEGFVVGTICSLLPLKCVDHLLAAFARLTAGGGRAARCVVIGDGPERTRLQTLSAELGIAEYCLFTGFLSDAATLLKGFDVFVLASRQEGMPRSILEAMLASRPVVAANVAGCRDLVRPGQTGFLYPHGDVDGLAEYLERLADDPSLRQRQGEAARTIVQTEYSLAAHINQIATVINRVARK